jgi:hypothetical protein
LFRIRRTLDIDTLVECECGTQFHSVNVLEHVATAQHRAYLQIAKDNAHNAEEVKRMLKFATDHV